MVGKPFILYHNYRSYNIFLLSGWNDWDQQQKDDFEIGEENSAFAHLAYVFIRIRLYI